MSWGGAYMRNEKKRSETSHGSIYRNMFLRGGLYPGGGGGGGL